MTPLELRLTSFFTLKPSILNPFQYVGQYGVYHDGETGLDFMQVRYYNSDFSRFITADTFPGLLESPVSQNAYLYANGDPINYVDPNGHFSWSFSGMLNSVKSFTTKAVKAVGSFLKSGWNAVKSFGQKVVGKAVNAYSKVKNKVVNYTKSKAEQLKEAARRAEEEARRKWEETKKAIIAVKEETKKMTQAAIDQATQAMKEKYKQAEEAVKSELSSMAQSAKKFLDSPTGQVIKDLVKIGTGVLQMDIGAQLALCPFTSIFGGKLLKDGYKNFSEGMQTKTGKVIGAAGKIVGGAIETEVGIGLIEAGIAGLPETGGLSSGLIAAGGLLVGHGLSTSTSGAMDFYYMGTKQDEKVGTFNLFKTGAQYVFGDEAGEGLSNTMDIASIFVGLKGIFTGLGKGIGNAGRIPGVPGILTEGSLVGKSSAAVSRVEQGVANASQLEREVATVSRVERASTVDIQVVKGTINSQKATEALPSSRMTEPISIHNQPPMALEGACFIAGTKVVGEKGLVSIETIKVNDKVYAENPETGEKGLKRVKNVFVREVRTLVYLQVNHTQIVTTTTHPFWVIGKGWVKAGELTTADEVRLYTGEKAHIESILIKELDQPVKVYNFEVEDWHTYFVSDQQVLVHNACWQEPPSSGSWMENSKISTEGNSNIQKTPVELNAFGNKTEPRGARPKQDFSVSVFDDIVGPEAPPFPKGASTVVDVNKAPLGGHYHTLPKGTELPEGLGVTADGRDVLSSSPHGPGHYTIYPTTSMTVDEFNNLFKSLPWQYGGKK